MTTPAAAPDYGDLLADRVAELRAQHESLTAAIEDMRLARSLAVADDEHDPEGSMVSLDQARDVALLQRTEQTLGELGAAQDRLAAGHYGRCETCGRAIPDERLQVRPEARRCVTC